MTARTLRDRKVGVWTQGNEMGAAAGRPTTASHRSGSHRTGPPKRGGWRRDLVRFFRVDDLASLGHFRHMFGEGASDLELLRGVARGDRGALGSLYDRYAGLLNQLGRRILREPQEAEDVVHEVFVELWQRAGDYDPERGAVRTWIMLRMRSRCLDRVRSARSSRRVALGVEEFESVAAPADESGSPDRARVRAMMGALPLAHREVIELGYFEGLSCSEIAERLAIPVGTVKSRVAGALHKMRVTVRELEQGLT